MNTKIAKTRQTNCLCVSFMFMLKALTYLPTYIMYIPVHRYTQLKYPFLAGYPRYTHANKPE